MLQDRFKGGLWGLAGAKHAHRKEPVRLFRENVLARLASGAEGIVMVRELVPDPTDSPRPGLGMLDDQIVEDTGRVRPEQMADNGLLDRRPPARMARRFSSCSHLRLAAHAVWRRSLGG